MGVSGWLRVLVFVVLALGCLLLAGVLPSVTVS
jgi:hypothetical protein